jgi:signal transduction histidine kinase
LDKHKAEQILINLLSNAAHACVESGREAKQVVARTRSMGDRSVWIEVEDNGVGIPQEDLVRIFGQGFSRRKGRRGFGLHSAALAAKEMGGVLSAHSDGLGKGARFTLELPLMPEKGAGPPGSTAESARPA